jgi:2,5-dioxopentanoate dehydrogenase
MDIRGDQWIAGEASREEKAATFCARNPVSGEELPGSFAEAGAAEIDRALQRAAEVHREWRFVERERRAALLEAAATQIEALGEELVQRACAETGLPRGRIEAERGRTTGQLRLFASTVRDDGHLDLRIEPGDPDRQPLPRPDLRSMLLPVGPVAVFGASNFPLAFSVAGGDTAAALAAGCPVVVKGHPSHPGTSELVARALNAAVAEVGAPAGLISMLQGASHAVGEGLVTHPETRSVAFTGSLQGGRALCELAARRSRPIPVFAEMGSVNPVFFLPGALAADPEGLAEAFFGSVTLGVGQFCTNPGLAIVRSGEAAERFAAALVAQAESAAPGTMLHRGIAEGFAAAAQALQGRGAERLGSGAELREGHAGARPAIFRVSGARFLAEPDLADECFGPSTLLVVCDSEAEIAEIVRALPGQLTATLHAGVGDEEQAAALTPDLVEAVGRLLFGGFPTGVEVSPAMVHGGPWPASSDARFTSVGTAAIRRFLRPVCWQNAPEALLPPELR